MPVRRCRNRINPNRPVLKGNPTWNQSGSISVRRSCQSEVTLGDENKRQTDAHQILRAQEGKFADNTGIDDGVHLKLNSGRNREAAEYWVKPSGGNIDRGANKCDLPDTTGGWDGRQSRRHTRPRADSDMNAEEIERNERREIEGSFVRLFGGSVV